IRRRGAYKDVYVSRWCPATWLPARRLPVPECPGCVAAASRFPAPSVPAANDEIGTENRCTHYVNAPVAWEKDAALLHLESSGCPRSVVPLNPKDVAAWTFPPPRVLGWPRFHLLLIPSRCHATLQI